MLCVSGTGRVRGRSLGLGAIGTSQALTITYIRSWGSETEILWRSEGEIGDVFLLQENLLPFNAVSTGGARVQDTGVLPRAATRDAVGPRL